MSYEKYEKSFGEFVDDVLSGVEFYFLDGGNPYHHHGVDDCVPLNQLKIFYDGDDLYVKKKVTLEDYLSDGGKVLTYKDGKYSYYEGEYYDRIIDVLACNYQIQAMLDYVWSNIKEKLDK